MKQNLLLAVSLVLVLGSASFAQENQAIDQGKLIRMRDSLDNLLVVSPTASAILIKGRKIEFYSFSSFLSNSQFNDKTGSSTNFSGEQLLFNTLLQVNYGISKNRRVNLGIDINYRSYRHDASAGSSVFSTLSSNPENVKGLTHVGARIRIQPFKRVRNFSYQTYAWIPVAEVAVQQALGSSKMNWGHTMFYYKYFNQRVGLFAQANFSFAFPYQTDDEESKTEFYLPVNLSVSYVASRKNIFYASLAYSRVNNDVSTVMEGADSDFAQYGVGYQRILTRRFYINIGYNDTFLARNYGKWNSMSLGINYQL